VYSLRNVFEVVGAKVIFTFGGKTGKTSIVEPN